MCFYSVGPLGTVMVGWSYGRSP